MALLESISIDKEKEKQPALDPFFLRKKGLDIIQKICGTKWTDFNLHDPGVTILEELSYVLTDLTYRIEFDIKDILTPAYDADIKPGKNAYYTPVDILTSDPITINDFRKLLIDQIDMLDNVWIEPVLFPGNAIGFSGLYEIWVQPTSRKAGELEAKSETVSGDKMPPSKYDLPYGEVSKYINQHRNLCENVLQIKFLKEVELTFHGNLYVKPSHDAEETLANVLFTIASFFSDRIAQYPLEDELKKGRSINDILNGPHLRKGYIYDNELKDKRVHYSVAAVSQAILKIDGVENITNFSLSAGDQFKVTDFIVIRPDSYLKPLLTKFSQNGFGLIVFKSNYEINIVADTVVNYLTDLESAQKQSFQLHSEVQVGTTIPQGKFRDIKKYDSMQNHFPQAYLLHKGSTGQRVSEKQRAYAKQLKAYLLFFEQLLANNFAQLNHVSDLFSIEDHLNKENTYFWQPLLGVPDVAPLLKNLEHLNGAGNEWSVANLKDLNDAASGEGYLRTLREAGESEFEFEERKIRMLDHLLARFGESVSEFSISTFDRYYNNSRYGKKKNTEIELKSRLLRNYDQLSKMRGRAADYRQEIWNTKSEPDGERYDISGLERKVAILLHIQNDRRRKLCEELTLSSLDIESVQQGDQQEESYIREAEWQGEDIEIIMKDLIVEDIIDENLEKGYFSFEGNKKDFLPRLLRYGTDINNYRIGLIKETYGDSNWFTLYREPEPNDDFDAEGETGKVWNNAKIVAKYDHRTQAKDSLYALIKRLRDISVNSEGFHLIEHVLLRHSIADVDIGSDHEAKFGFIFLDRNGNAFLESYETCNFRDRRAHIEEVLDACINGKFHTINVDDRHYKIVVHRNQNTLGNSAPEEQIIAESIQTYEIGISGEDQKESSDKIKMKYLSLEIKNNPGSYFPQLRLYKKLNINHEGTDTVKTININEEFYNLQASIILPDWPVRFQDDGFRRHLEDTFKENAPVHLKLHFHWLEFTEMEEFENLYYEWSLKKMEDIKKKPGTAEDPELIRLSDQMAAFLKLKDFNPKV